MEKLLKGVIEFFINNQKDLKPEEPSYTRNGFFVYSDKLQEHVEQSGVEVQDYLCELMQVYQSYHDFALTQQYVVRGSILKCRYGTKPALLDTIWDHGVYMRNVPVMTCRDCNSWNIHNFGSCMCPESIYEKRLPMTTFRHPNGEVAKLAPYNKFPHICVPVIDVIGGWQQEEPDVEIIDGEEVQDALVDRAVLGCRYGGLIQIVEIKVYEEVDEEEPTVKYTELGGLLFQIELPYKNEDFIIENGIRIAVKPHNAKDGYVTIGAGHCIQDDDEASKYGFSTGQKQIVSDVIISINEQLEKYGETLDNPAILTIDEARMLLETDLLEYRETAQPFMDEQDTDFTDNEKDAITSVVYNGNNAYNPNNFLFYLLKHDQKGAMDILHTALANGWYDGREGTLRRRLMEYNVFFNNSYRYYDSNELDELKEAVEW